MDGYIPIIGPIIVLLIAFLLFAAGTWCTKYDWAAGLIITPPVYETNVQIGMQPTLGCDVIGMAEYCAHIPAIARSTRSPTTSSTKPDIMNTTASTIRHSSMQRFGPIKSLNFPSNGAVAIETTDWLVRINPTHIVLLPCNETYPGQLRTIRPVTIEHTYRSFSVVCSSVSI